MARPHKLATALGLALIASGAQAGDRARELTSLVREDCGSCHGMTLNGGLGVALTPDELSEKDAAALASIILDGVPGTPMPPWRGLITEADARWIADRLKRGFPQ